MIKRLLRNKVAQNAGWLVGSRIIQMVLSFFISLLTARYLGPGNYGLINYATAYTTFFSSLCTLGLNSIIVKELIDNSRDEGEVLGTAIMMRMISSVVSILSIVGLSILFDKGDSTTTIVVILCNLGLLLQVFDIVHYWFQAHLMSKYSAIVNLVAYLVLSGYRIFLLATGKNVIWFALSMSIDHFVVAALLLIFYRKKSQGWLSVSLSRAKLLIGKSYHFILSGLMISIYNSTDRLMLKQIMNESEVGYYSLSISICTMWTFVLTAIIDSMTPGIFQKAKDEEWKMFNRSNKRLYAIVFYASVAVSIMFCVFGTFIIRVLYGTEYLPTVDSLRIITWFVAFSYLGSARNIWIVTHNKQKYIKYITAIAAFGNIAMNFLLIPWMGASGAALASLMTQVFTCIVLPYCFKPLRENAIMMIEAICLRFD